MNQTKSLSFDLHTYKRDMGKYLTTSQKDNLTPALIKRDGANCFYCGTAFQLTTSRELKRTIDHLDDNYKNNVIENLVLAHRKCNQLKKSYPEFKIMAEEKLKENHSSFDYLGESVGQTAAHKPASKEIDLNVAYAQLTEEYLNERLIRQGKAALNYNGAAEAIAFMMWQKTKHGSPTTVKRHLDMFTSDAAPFKTIQEGGETLIIKRT